MSIQVANLSLVGFGVGQGSKIDLSKVLQPATIQQQMRPTQVAGSTLILFNESGSGLTCTFPLAQETFTLAAGAWKQVMVPPAEIEMDFTVAYILQATPPVSQLLADLYLPGEVIDSIGTLGNSPISGASSLTTKIPVNTTGGNQVTIEFGPDAHSLSDWEFICVSNGDFILWDNKNAREVWRGVLANGDLQADADILLGSGQAGPSFTRLQYNGAANLTNFWTPQGGSEQDILFLTWSGAASINLFGLGTNNPAPALTNLANNGGFSRIASQATVGSFGVPVIVAQGLHVAVPTTALTTILSVSAPATGLYRMSTAFVLNNGTQPQKPNILVGWTDPDLSLTNNDSPSSLGLLINGANNFNNGGYDCTVLSFYAKTGTTISVLYQDNAGTPNDHCTAVLERLA